MNVCVLTCTFTVFLYESIYIYIYIYTHTGMMVRVFANGLGDLVSIPGGVIPKTQKMVLDAASLSIIRYGSRIK